MDQKLRVSRHLLCQETSKSSMMMQKNVRRNCLWNRLYINTTISSQLLNAPAYRALRYRETLQGEIITLIGMVLDDGEPALQGLLMKLASKWDQLISTKGGPPCPLKYSAAEIERQQELERRWAEGMGLMDDVLDLLGGAVRGWDGWVSHEEYEPLKKKLAMVREQFIEHFAGNNKEAAEAWEKAWPFQ